MVMTETRIGEIPSFFLANRVVLLVTAFFAFIRFLVFLFGRKQQKEIYPQFCSGKKR